MFKKLSSGYRTPENGSTTPSHACPDTPTTHGTAAVSIPANWRTRPHARVRRVSRKQEASALHRGRAILHMQARLADSQVQWLRTVDAHLATLPLRADAKAHRRAIARMIGFHADWQELVTRTLTWATIASQVGLTRRSVARHLKALHEDGWIGRVAAGRSAAAKQAAGWTGPDAEENEAPVYALTVPLDDPDINVTPPTSSGYKESPARTREQAPPEGAATRPTPVSAHAASGESNPEHPASPAKPLWPAHAPAKRKDERVLASRALQARIPALMRISDRHVASVLRDFMLAGWTIRDLHKALDALPDGRAQGHFVEGQWVPFSGADGIPPARMGHWLRFRLAHWRDRDGSPVESPSQKDRRRREADEVHRAAQARAREERAARRRALATDPKVQAAKQAALAQIRGLRRR